MISVELF